MCINTWNKLSKTSRFLPKVILYRYSFLFYWSFKKHVTALTYKCQTVLFALLLNRVDFILKYFDFMFVIKKVTVKVVFIYFFKSYKKKSRGGGHICNFAVKFLRQKAHVNVTENLLTILSINRFWDWLHLKLYCQDNYC